MRERAYSGQSGRQRRAEGAGVEAVAYVYTRHLQERYTVRRHVLRSHRKTTEAIDTHPERRSCAQDTAQRRSRSRRLSRRGTTHVRGICDRMDRDLRRQDCARDPSGHPQRIPPCPGTRLTRSADRSWRDRVFRADAPGFCRGRAEGICTIPRLAGTRTQHSPHRSRSCQSDARDCSRRGDHPLEPRCGPTARSTRRRRRRQAQPSSHRRRGNERTRRDPSALPSTRRVPGSNGITDLRGSAPD